MTNFLEFLGTYDLTNKVSDLFKSYSNFTIDEKLPQRKLVDLGRIIARMVTAQYVVELGSAGFRKDLVQDCLETLKYDVSKFISTFDYLTDVNPIEGYGDNSDWLKFC